ncbi:hypothetical protein MLD38_010961 [Melastoma candidum]|uniref:Uncharacterized protein n=1 Tax=Melastoma candidum TaxID=119954 RepID=A0ACB9R5P1_9MYRT|nr:hypothetical protein MLD38_010961 [Melastoma candidum]
MVGSQNESRGKRSERGSDQGMDDDGQLSSQRLERKFSEQNLSMPPTYEEAVSESRSPDQGTKEVEKAAIPPPKSLSPPKVNITGAAKNVSSSPSSPQMPVVETLDDFDPVAHCQPTSSKTTDTDLFGSFADPSSDNSLALVPVTTLTTEAKLDSLDFSGSASRFSASASASVGSKQPYEDPFGDSPFKANGVPPPATQLSVQASDPSTAGSTFSGFPSQQPSIHQYSTLDPNTDILAGILALPASSPATTPEVMSTTGIDPYGTVEVMGAPTLIPIVSNQYYGNGGMPPHIHGHGTMFPQMGQGASMNYQLAAPQLPRDNFQPKSTIWPEMLSWGWST